MSKYIVIDYEELTVWQTDDYNDINQGYSVKCRDAKELEEQTELLTSEEIDTLKYFEQLERDNRRYQTIMGE